VRILVADDHPLYLSAVSEQVGRAFSQTMANTATCLSEVLNALSSQDPFDLLLIDYSMPGMNGRSGIQAVVSASKGAPVVVMSGIAMASEVSTCIGVGAKAFLPKTLDGKIFTSALNLVLAGGSYLPAEMFAADVEEHAAEPEARDDDFTERERGIMAMVVEGQSNKEIARVLNLREVTIKVQLTHIYKKLGAKNRAQAATLISQGRLLS